LAEGGDVTPGRAYLVGERGPEIRTFGAAGQITPLKNIRGGDHNVTINNTFPGVKDNDLFRRSVTQNAGLQMRMISIAYGK